ncbi:hypothetical protein K491DRAFT_588109 [Lophiostoma macrostomum CBS 122681]|uniref:Cell surface spherulin 4-like protein n=1 Tax=Lophiostoma macrostomum CBS 122681 TaxID=1314788 RepID=A0A6A6TQS4_9PLEO|nr:hypothetical protein K491DRAFT_588109 [Lophiostoma macrostomum CBS 122681]
MSEIPRSKILLPLYIYPHPGAWDPLHAAVVAHPSIDFIVIVNPNSGPGAPPWWPNTDYTREIPKLKACKNVQTVGYVRTNYCMRAIEEVVEDIATYAQWSHEPGIDKLGVEGIFFDETPNASPDKGNFEYLSAITRRVKETEGILGNRTVIHNPGTVIDSLLADSGPDIVTVVEQTFETFREPSYQDWLKTSCCSRSQSCFMVHSVPSKHVHSLARELRDVAAYVFVTDLRQDYYQRFAHSWGDFISALAED